MTPPERRILKDSLHRSVRLEIDAAGVRTVVKRFASRGVAAATLDRARASREHRLLGELSARGIPTPRPLSLARIDGGWEVRMEWIEAAQPLAEHLREPGAWPLEPARAARALARLLAALHDAGVDHPDLHPGNVLLDARGGVWAIDFHKARRARRLRGATAWRDLVTLAACVRESTSPLFRARFLLEWLRRAPAALVSDLRRRRGAATHELAAAIESAARTLRRASVARRRARWLRDSSSCRVERERWTGFERHERPAPDDFDPRTPSTACTPQRPALLLENLSAAQARALWCCAARLEEHGLPALRPRAMGERPTPFVWLDAPSGGRACERPGDVRGARALRSLGLVCAQLADRGLRVVRGPWPALWRTARGELLLAATAQLEDDPRAGDGIDLVRALALAGLSLEQLTGRERAAFAAGIVAGAALGSRAKAQLRARLRHV